MNLDIYEGDIRSRTTILTLRKYRTYKTWYEEFKNPIIVAWLNDDTSDKLITFRIRADMRMKNEYRKVRKNGSVEV